MHSLDISIAVSSFQASRLLLFSSSGSSISLLPRLFRRCMGIDALNNNLVVTDSTSVQFFANMPELAASYPRQPDTYTDLLVPRAKWITGDLDIHDVAITSRGILAVNTKFSCICLIGESYSFVPIWTPPFISALEPDDRCHLNGFACEGEEPTWATALGSTDTQEGWRNTTDLGILLHLPSNTLAATELSMPHSPRVHNNKVYFCEASDGTLSCYDPHNNNVAVIYTANGFTRGLDIVGDYALVGVSGMREGSRISHLVRPEFRSASAHIDVVDLRNGTKVGSIQFQGDLREVSNIRVLQGWKRPGILNMESDLHTKIVSTPNASYWTP